MLMKSTKHSEVFTILYEIFAARCSVAVVFTIFILLWHTDTHTHTYTVGDICISKMVALYVDRVFYTKRP